MNNKLEMIRRGNSKSFNNHTELVKKAMNKEDRYSHLVLIDEDICRVSAYLRHTIQTVVLSDTSPEFCNICLSLKTGSFPCSVKD